ncbi:MAG: amino acid ABC transporter substrate-binding protein [Deltaproteobacteria bacterium]|nr:amino acid ABC transporter substrate-binding protein [Deltaproteobacteria bacterium]
MATTLDRRTFLKVAAGGVAAAGLFPRIGRAQATPVRIGFTLSATGPYSVGAGITQGPNYHLWVEQVNAKGGLLVRGQGRRPVQLIHHDDRSEIETAVRLYEKLITEDKVDLLLPPWGTAMNFAVAPVANKHGYPLIGPTVGSMKLYELNLPYFYAVLAQPDSMMRALAEFLKDLRSQARINKVAVIHVADLFGLEHQAALMPLLREAGFDVVEAKSYPLGVKDLSDLLKSIKAKGAEAFIALSYPPDTILATTQAKAVDFNPAVFYGAVGTAFPFFRDRFKASAEGVFGIGAWNPKVPYPGAKEYFDAHVRKWQKEPDRWASAFTYATLQILEQAVGQVSLDRARIKSYLDATEFSTVVGPIRFTRGLNRATPGMVGQWQKGEFEVVWPRDRATARPIFPKPAWQ